MLDTQITELAGRHDLISQLLAGGVEAAVPVRDRGVDLIAYIERDESSADQLDFVACPIQRKTRAWTEGGKYSLRPGATWQKDLSNYVMDSTKWASKIRSTATSRAEEIGQS